MRFPLFCEESDTLWFRVLCLALLRYCETLKENELLE